MKNKNKKTAENARMALKIASAMVIADPNLSINDVFAIADKEFAFLQK